MSSLPNELHTTPQTQSHESGAMMRSGQVADQSNAAAENGQSAPAVNAKSGSEKNHRTTGNRVFDWVLYPLIPFGGVFTVSVLGGREASFGNGWWSRAMNSVAEGLETLKKTGLSKPSLGTRQTSLVLVSFGIGTLFMAPVKLFENARGKISSWIDKKLGTEPKAGEHIKEEPNQSWGSVLGGRALTFATVLGLDKIIGSKIESSSEKFADWWVGQNAHELLNEARKPMSDPALKTMAQEARDTIRTSVAENVTSIRRDAGRSWQYKFMIGYEAIYTALCTVLVYGISRALARGFNKSEKPNPQVSDVIPKAERHSAPEQSTTKTEPSVAVEASPEVDGRVRGNDAHGSAAERYQVSQPASSKAEQVLARKEQAAEAGVSLAY